MQQRLPRWLPFLGARPQVDHPGRPAALPDDPWAGEDDDWTYEDVTADEPADFVRFFRGLAVGLLVGVGVWALFGLLLALLLG